MLIAWFCKQNFEGWDQCERERWACPSAGTDRSFQILIHCSSWIFALILIFCKLRENTIYLVYCFWHLLEFCPRSEHGTWLTLFLALPGSPSSWALWPLSLDPAGRQTWWSPMWFLIIWATWGKRLNLSDPQLPHLLQRITVVAATQAVGRIQWAILGHVAVNPEPASSQRPVTAFVSAVLDSEPSSDLEGCIHAAY